VAEERRVFATGVGVDLNRNFARATAPRAPARYQCELEVYKGPSASSEAETITMQTWSAAERFAKVLDYHSYGREVLYAYLCPGASVQDLDAERGQADLAGVGLRRADPPAERGGRAPAVGSSRGWAPMRF
jgi:hypothetical protein